MNKYLISNYGNINKIDENKECYPEYIKLAINKGYYVKINVFYINNNFYIGNNIPKYYIDINFLYEDKIFVNPMDIETEIEIYKYNDKLKIYKNFNIIEPDFNNDFNEINYNNYEGICSNFIENINKQIESKKRYALIISGTIRRFEENFLNQLEDFYKNNNDIYIDIFVSINSSYNDLINKFKNNIYLTRLKYEVYYLDRKLLENSILRSENTELKYKFKTYNSSEPNEMKNKILRGNEIIFNNNNDNFKLVPIFTNINNTLSMYYNQHIAFKMLEEYSNINNINYKQILVYRTDIVSDKLPFIFNDIKDDNIYYSSIHIFNKEWINNAFVLGTFNTIKIYCSLYSNIDNYTSNNIPLHSESLITHHLKQNNIKFNIIDENIYRYKLDENR